MGETITWKGAQSMVSDAMRVAEDRRRKFAEEEAQKQEVVEGSICSERPDAGIRRMEFKLRTRVCTLCHREMMRKDTIGLFPISPSQEEQMREKGIVFESGVKVDDRYICAECVKEGKADFNCFYCGNRYPINEVQEAIGDPPDFLCKKCYGTVPARDWNLTIKKLENKHRYDFEL